MTPTRVTAPTAGSIIVVRVAVGDVVAADQDLIVIESMKMEIPVTSPVAGRVAAVLVKPADPVNQGDVLAEVEPE